MVSDVSKSLTKINTQHEKQDLCCALRMPGALCFHWTGPRILPTIVLMRGVAFSAKDAIVPMK